jgi:YbbR domain-containing protein
MKKNFGLKVFAVVMALALWFFVVSKGKAEIRIDVPVVYENVPSGLVVLDDSDRSVEVVVWGHERFIRNLSESDVGIVIDLTGAVAGMKHIPLEHDDVRLPASFKVVSIMPGHINVHIGGKGGEPSR